MIITVAITATRAAMLEDCKGVLDEGPAAVVMAVV